MKNINIKGLVFNLITPKDGSMKVQAKVNKKYTNKLLINR